MLTGNAAAALSPRAVYAVPTFLQKGGGLKTSVLVYPVLLMRKQCWNKEWYLKINIRVQHTGRLSMFAHFMQLLLWRYWTRLCWRHWSLGPIHCYVFNLYNEASSLLSIFGANNRNELNSKLWHPTNVRVLCEAFREWAFLMFWLISCCLFFLLTQPDVIGGVSWYFVAEVVDYLLLMLYWKFQP